MTWVDAVRYSFIVMDLHHLLLAGLPAHSGLPLPNNGHSQTTPDHVSKLPNLDIQNSFRYHA